MAGSALELFTDFVKATGPAFLKNAEDVILEAVKQTYTIPRLWAGKEQGEILQGGETIKDSIIFSENSSYEHYHPNQEFTYTNPQVLTNWSIPWRFTKDEMVWTDHEIGLNTGELSKGARHHKFKTLKRVKEQNLWAGLCNGMERDLWAQPNRETMEVTTGKVPYSIPVFINEFSNGLPPAASGGSAWTVVQGIDPASETKWRNQTETYEQAPTAATWDLFPAFSKMYHKTRFDQLPKRPELSDPTTAPNFIACSLGGISNYEKGLRISQDTFVTSGRQDPAYAMPMYRGIPLIMIDMLDNVALYDDGSSGFGSEEAANVDENGAALTDADKVGPRYYFINGRYMAPVIHAERFFHKGDPFSPSRQPFTKIMMVDLWHNLACRSRQRHGLVSPSEDIAAS